MRSLITGATGFTGRRVAGSLIELGHEVRCFVREGSEREALVGLDVEFAVGELDRPETLVDALRSCDALVNVASIGFGHAPGIVEACLDAEVNRAVFFSTTAIFTSLPAASRSVRLAAEDAIRDSGLEWTILRPTMIFGAPGDRNVERLLSALEKYPVFPVVGGGARLIQPVFVDDLALLAARVVGTRESIGRAYCVPGRRPLRFRDFVLLCAEALGRRVRLLNVPEAMARGLARVYERLARHPRIRSEQVERLLEDKDFDWRAAKEDVGYAPRAPEEAVRIAVERLGAGDRS